VVVIGLVMKLALGIVLMWLYAIARAQFGASPRTATRIALVVWLLAAIFFADFPLTGMMSWTTDAIVEGLQLMAFLAAALAGAWFYRAPERSATRRGALPPWIARARSPEANSGCL
jgi:hypothetical protein